MTTKPRTEPPEWAWTKKVAYAIEKSRLTSGEPDPQLVLAIAIVISLHPNPAVKELVDAARLQVQNFKRQNLAPEINDLGDDDHEAWTALESALKPFQAPTGGE